MTDWYYADHHNQQQGPVSADALLDLHRQGHLNDSSLVWTDGMTDWSAFHTQRERLAGDNGAAAAPALQQPAGAWQEAVPVAAGPVVHAGLWRRVAASCIDGLVTGVLSYVLIIPLALMFGLSAGALLGTEPSGGASLLFNVIQLTISLGIPAVYFAWMHSSRHQASLGKLAVGIKVVRTDGNALGFGRALGRYFAYTLFVVLTCGLGVLISGLMVAFSERKQALHDMICDSIVTDRWAFTDQPEQQKTGLDTVTIIVLVLLGLLVVGGIVLGILAGAALAAMLA